MGGYRKKVGGYDWHSTLVEMRQDLRSASVKLEGLLPAARTQETRADVLEVQNLCLQVALDVERLLRMEEK